MDLARETLLHGKWSYRQRMDPSGEGFLILAVLVALMLGGLWLVRRLRERSVTKWLGQVGVALLLGGSLAMGVFLVGANPSTERIGFLVVGCGCLAAGMWIRRRLRRHRHPTEG